MDYWIKDQVCHLVNKAYNSSYFKAYPAFRLGCVTVPCMNSQPAFSVQCPCRHSDAGADKEPHWPHFTPGSAAVTHSYR